MRSRDQSLHPSLVGGLNEDGNVNSSNAYGQLNPHAVASPMYIHDRPQPAYVQPQPQQQGTTAYVVVPIQGPCYMDESTRMAAFMPSLHGRQQQPHGASKPAPGTEGGTHHSTETIQYISSPTQEVPYRCYTRSRMSETMISADDERWPPPQSSQASQRSSFTDTQRSGNVADGAFVPVMPRRPSFPLESITPLPFSEAGYGGEGDHSHSHRNRNRNNGDRRSSFPQVSTGSVEEWMQSPVVGARQLVVLQPLQQQQPIEARLSLSTERMSFQPFYAPHEASMTTMANRSQCVVVTTPNMYAQEQQQQVIDCIPVQVVSASQVTYAEGASSPHPYHSPYLRMQEQLLRQQQQQQQQRERSQSLPPLSAFVACEEASTPSAARACQTPSFHLCHCSHQRIPGPIQLQEHQQPSQQQSGHVRRCPPDDQQHVHKQGWQPQQAQVERRAKPPLEEQDASQEGMFRWTWSLTQEVERAAAAAARAGPPPPLPPLAEVQGRHACELHGAIRVGNELVAVPFGHINANRESVVDAASMPLLRRLVELVGEYRREHLEERRSLDQRPPPATVARKSEMEDMQPSPSTLPSTKGWEANKGSAVLFVGQLPLGVTAAELTMIFSFYGPVTYVKVMRDHRDGDAVRRMKAELNRQPRASRNYQQRGVGSGDGATTVTPSGGNGGVHALDLDADELLRVTDASLVPPRREGEIDPVHGRLLGGSAFIFYPSTIYADAAIAALHGKFLLKPMTDTRGGGEGISRLIVPTPAATRGSPLSVTSSRGTQGRGRSLPTSMRAIAERQERIAARRDARHDCTRCLQVAYALKTGSVSFFGLWQALRLYRENRGKNPLLQQRPCLPRRVIATLRAEKVAFAAEIQRRRQAATIENWDRNSQEASSRILEEERKIWAACALQLDSMNAHYLFPHVEDPLPLDEAPDVPTGYYNGLRTLRKTLNAFSDGESDAASVAYQEGDGNATGQKDDRIEREGNKLEKYRTSVPVEPLNLHGLICRRRSYDSELSEVLAAMDVVAKGAPGLNTVACIQCSQHMVRTSCPSDNHARSSASREERVDVTTSHIPSAATPVASGDSSRERYEEGGMLADGTRTTADRTTYLARLNEAIAAAESAATQGATEGSYAFDLQRNCFPEERTRKSLIMRQDEPLVTGNSSLAVLRLRRDRRILQFVVRMMAILRRLGEATAACAAVASSSAGSGGGGSGEGGSGSQQQEEAARSLTTLTPLQQPVSQHTSLGGLANGSDGKERVAEEWGQVEKPDSDTAAGATATTHNNGSVSHRTDVDTGAPTEEAEVAHHHYITAKLTARRRRESYGQLYRDLVTFAAGETASAVRGGRSRRSSETKATAGYETGSTTSSLTAPDSTRAAAAVTAPTSTQRGAGRHGAGAEEYSASRLPLDPLIAYFLVAYRHYRLRGHLRNNRHIHNNASEALQQGHKQQLLLQQTAQSTPDSEPWQREPGPPVAHRLNASSGGDDEGDKGGDCQHCDAGGFAGFNPYERNPFALIEPHAEGDVVDSEPS